MKSDLRRTKRSNDFIAVSVVARNGLNGKREAGPFPGRIINISRHGACLLMSLGVLESYQVFRKTYQNDSSYLEIQGYIRPESDKFKITARPAWTDPFIMDEFCAFKMGIEFMINSDDQKMNSVIEALIAKEK